MTEDRYIRQMMLSGFGKESQQKLFQASVLVIGAGGLGCPVLEILVSSGVGKIGIVDFDVVEMHNLHRQFLFDENNVGKPKALMAKMNLERRNSETEIEAYDLRVTSKNISSIIEKYDVIVDCTDNFSTRYLVNDACSLLRKPMVYGSIFRYEGQISVFNVMKNGISTNYRDLYPKPPQPKEVPSCNEAGVLPFHSAMIGTIQANEVIKIIIGSKDVLANELLVFNSLNYQTLSIRFDKKQENHAPKTLEELENFNYGEFCCLCGNDEITSMDELKSFLKQEKSILLDVREPYEQPKISIFQTLELPLGSVEDSLEVLKSYDNICFVCVSGMRSRKALEMVKKHFPEKLLKNFSLGVKGIKE